MLIRLRRGVFYLCVGLYLVVCPLTILSALGYLVVPGASPGMVTTGLISLATVPPGATIFLSGRRYTRTTPTLLRDLLPGDYAVRMVLPGHQPWERTVRVEGERATVLERVILLPQTFPVVEVIQRRGDRLIPGPGGRSLVVATGPAPAPAWRYAPAAERVEPFIAGPSPRLEGWALAPPADRPPPFVVTPGGELLATDPPATVLARGVRGLVLEERRGRAACWQQDRVGVVEPGGPATIAWLPYQGRSITQVFWVYKGSHLLLHDGDTLVLLEWEEAGAPVARPLSSLALKPQRAVLYVEATGTCYFLDRASGFLCAVTLVPARPLLPLMPDEAP